MNQLLPTEEDVSSWSLIDVDALLPEVRKHFNLRCDALRAVVGGKPIAAAAAQHAMNRTTLSKVMKDCTSIASDGRPWGWRACIPRRCRQQNVSQSVPPIPEIPRPGAFTTLLRALPLLIALLASFSKRLPTRTRHSPAFEAFFKKFLKTIRDRSQGKGYPFTAADSGRRAVIEHLKKLRRASNREVGDEDIVEETPSQHANEFFDFGVMERLEFDAHRKDVDFAIEVPDGAAGTKLRRISAMWLLIVIDRVSRLVVAWTLVIGRSYSQVNVLQLFTRALTPWAPRDLIVPGMRYIDASGVGTSAAVGRLLRGIMTAGDNALAHHAKLTTANLTERFRGVLNFGPAHVPETRALVEAFFKKIESGALRHMPGAFEPGRGGMPKRKTNQDQPETYPLNLVALQDLMDVVISGYNATELQSGRSPLETIRYCTHSGRWAFESSRDEHDAAALGVMRFPVTVHGDQKNGRQPYVNFKRARYRGHGLTDRWDLVRKTFSATACMDDLRYLTLRDTYGDIFARLTALPPWSRTPHDLDLRRLVVNWSNRKLFSIRGVDDAIEAYKLYVRSVANVMPAAVDQIARHPEFHSKQSRDDARRTTRQIEPRDGFITFDDAKDPTR